MHSPFPGMDPYIERFWNDVGGSLIVYISDELNTVMPPEFRASFRPRLETPDCDFHQDYAIEIVKGERDQIITAIEVLSPENKCEGVGMTHFKRMQKEYRARGINRVWIDLLREGDRMLEFPTAQLKVIPRSPYLITTYLPNSGKAELYPIDLRTQLPTIRIPLDSSDLYAVLPLQPLISRIYQRSRFRINYDLPCNPPLTGEDYAVAREILDHRK